MTQGHPVLLLLAAWLPAQTQFTVVPAACAGADATSHLWIAGASADLRQQTLIGPSHLTTLVGRTLLALELRRSAANETYAGGTAHLVVRLSTAPRPPLRGSPTFAQNVGSDEVQVFAGAVALPTSAPEPGPAVPWTPANVVRIPFTAPFVYLGGTLCVDVTGQAQPGLTADWWMADAVFEDLAGTAAPGGAGCGPYGGPLGQWSFVSTRQLVPGAHARFTAHGTPWGIGIAMLGQRSPFPIPMTALGLPAPGCDLHLMTLDLLLPALFVPELHPGLQSLGGFAEVRPWIPDDAAMFGVTLTAQWLDLGPLRLSNAIEWTIAGAMPSLDLAVVEGHPAEPAGEIAVHMAHVLRLEHQ